MEGVNQTVCESLCDFQNFSTLGSPMFLFITAALSNSRAKVREVIGDRGDGHLVELTSDVPGLAVGSCQQPYLEVMVGLLAVALTLRHHAELVVKLLIISALLATARFLFLLSSFLTCSCLSLSAFFSLCADFIASRQSLDFFRFWTIESDIRRLAGVFCSAKALMCHSQAHSQTSRWNKSCYLRFQQFKRNNIFDIYKLPVLHHYLLCL